MHCSNYARNKILEQFHMHFLIIANMFLKHLVLIVKNIDKLALVIDKVMCDLMNMICYDKLKHLICAIIIWQVKARVI